MTRLHDLAGLGQSIRVDHVRRGFTRSGEPQAIVGGLDRLLQEQEGL